MRQIKRKSFVLYMDFEDAFQYLSMEERGILFTTIYAYVSGNPIPEDLPNMVKMAFCFIRKTLDRDAVAYEERCRTAVENGKKGGRPRKEKFFAEKTESVFQKPDNDNVNDSESVNGNEGETSSEPLPCSASDLGSALPRSADIEVEEKALEAMGVPLDYAKERWERARSYGALHGQGVGEVLLSWWREDERRKKPSHKRSPPPMENKSYDLEDFLQAALEGSYRALDVP